VEDDGADGHRIVLGPRFYNQQGQYLCDHFPCPTRADPPTQAVEATTSARTADVPAGPSIQLYQQTMASAAEVKNAVGGASFSMDNCTQSHAFEDDRVVRVTVRKPNLDWPGVIDALLVRAAHFAWQRCPRPYTRGVGGGGEPTGDYHYDLKRVVIYGRDGSRLFEATLGGTLRGDGFLSSGDTYRWNEVQDYGAQQRQQEAKATAQAQAATQQVQSQQAFTRSESGGGFWATFWIWVRLILLGLVLLWIVENREMLLRWYYGLKPHPATDIVESRIHGGGPIDGALFAEIMRPVPGGRIEKRIRAEQASKLAAMAREAAEARLRELERLKAKALQEAEFIRAQSELHEAVEGHEMVMARLDAVREWRKRHGR
jgi:hypothetical protein